MPELDGNGWVSCGCGHRHWGRHGAAGLLLESHGEVLVQLRPWWAHQGNNWSIPGGARDSHETVVAAALREAHEETALDMAGVTIEGVHRLQHPDWRYDTVLASATTQPITSPHAESVQLRWVAMEQVPTMNLHPGLAAAWPELTLPRVHLVVDVANVVGAVPDGWWRDRVAATQRVLDRLERVCGQALPTASGRVLCTGITAVLEGRARAAPDRGLCDLVAIHRAQGVGDDAVVRCATGRGDSIVVSSDRGLRARVQRSVPVSQLEQWEAR